MHSGREGVQCSDILALRGRPSAPSAPPGIELCALKQDGGLHI